MYVPLGSPAEFCETASEPSEPIAAVPAVDAQPHENCTVPPSSAGCEAYDAVNAGELDALFGMKQLAAGQFRKEVKMPP